jgi:rRNA-processing protein FCF1
LPSAAINYEGHEPEMLNAPAKKQPLKVIVDSNALFVPLQFKIDIFVELERVLNRHIELILLSPVKRELETLTQKSSPKMRKNATFALSLAEKCKYVKVVEKPKEQTDEAIVRVAQAWKVPVFTNDKLLKKKLRDISMPVIYVREKSRLEIDGLIS